MPVHMGIHKIEDDDGGKFEMIDGDWQGHDKLIGPIYKCTQKQRQRVSPSYHADIIVVDEIALNLNHLLMQMKVINTRTIGEYIWWNVLFLV